MGGFIGLIFSFCLGAGAVISGIYIGKRIKESSWRKNNIYKPLFNELNDVLNFKNPPVWENYISSVWERFDEFSKFLAESDVKTQVENYLVCVESYRNFLATDKTKEDLAEAFFEVMPQMVSEDRKSLIIKKEQDQQEELDIIEFFSLFGGIILSSQSKEELAKQSTLWTEKKKIEKNPLNELFLSWGDFSNKLIDLFAKGKIQGPYQKTLNQLKERINRILNAAARTQSILYTQLTKIW